MWDHDLNQAVGEQGWLDLDNPSTLLSCFLEGSPKESHNAVHCRMTLPNPPAPAQSDQSNTPISQWGGERLPVRNITEIYFSLIPSCFRRGPLGERHHSWGERDLHSDWIEAVYALPTEVASPWQTVRGRHGVHQGTRREETQSNYHQDELRVSHPGLRPLCARYTIKTEGWNSFSLFLC